MTKKLPVLLLVLCMTAGYAACPVHITQARAEVQTETGFRYNILSDDAIELTGYSGSGSSVSIPSAIDGRKVTCIGYAAFDNCRGLSHISIPESVTSITSSFIRDCSDLTAITVQENNPAYVSRNGILYNKSETDLLMCPQGKAGSLQIPASVTQIGPDAFRNCTLLTAVTFPEGVARIGQDAFRNCTSLTKTVLPESMTEIGDHAFYGCTGLTDITIPKNVTSLNQYYTSEFPFENCTSLKSITVDVRNPVYASVKGLLYNKEKNCLLFCPKGASGKIRIPEGVTQIGHSALSGCSVLTDITLPDSLTQIGPRAFHNCKKLTRITIPEGVTQIEYAAFSRCSSLKKIVIPEGITQIDNFVFRYCKELTHVSLPEGVNRISSRAFYGCRNLRTISLPESLTAIDIYAFYNCKKLTGIIFPEKLAGIGFCAFHNCKSLTDITIPEGISRIRHDLFSGCTALENVTLPESVEQIRDCAFADCTSLKNLTIRARNMKKIGKDVLRNIHPEAVIHVPAGMVTIYKQLLKDKGQQSTVEITGIKI